MLLFCIEHLYVEPRLKYDSQVAENEVTTRIKKAAKSLTMTEHADKIAEAVSAERVPDPKIVKVLIKDAVEKKFKEAATANKKQKQQKLPPSSTSSKDVRGSQRKGGASLKKKYTFFTVGKKLEVGQGDSPYLKKKAFQIYLLDCIHITIV